MDVNSIYTGKYYLYHTQARYAIRVEAIAVDTRRKQVLVRNVNTRKTLFVSANKLTPAR